MNQKAKKGIKIGFNVLFWVFFAAALGLTILSFASSSGAAGYPKFGKKALFSIQSDSMKSEDGFKKGDMIVCTILDKEEKNQLKKGDVITYLVNDPSSPINGQYCTHRIVEEPKQHENVSGIMVYMTKGDAESEAAATKAIYSENVEAVWTGKKIGGLGGVVTFLNKPYGFWPCIILPLSGFLGYEVYCLVKEIQKAKGKDKRLISKADEELIKQQAIEEYKKQLEEKNKKTK